MARAAAAVPLLPRATVVVVVEPDALLVDPPQPVATAATATSEETRSRPERPRARIGRCARIRAIFETVRLRALEEQAECLMRARPAQVGHSS